MGRDAGSVVVCGGFQAFDCQVGDEDVFCEVEGRGPGFGFQGLVAFAVAPVAEGAAVADWSAVSVVAVVDDAAGCVGPAWVVHSVFDDAGYGDLAQYGLVSGFEIDSFGEAVDFFLCDCGSGEE